MSCTLIKGTGEQMRIFTGAMLRVDSVASTDDVGILQKPELRDSRFHDETVFVCVLVPER